jgi:hypothetical protein
MKTVYYNVHGVHLNDKVKHVANGAMNKKVREFYAKNPSMRAFLQGVERVDERLIQGALKIVEMEETERVVRSGTWDRGLLIVVGGTLYSYDAHLEERKEYVEGAILGTEQFLFNKPWDRDIFCAD